MRNNKGVTLVELLIVIVVMGIIAAFSVPAVGAILENTEKDAILQDARTIENAAGYYCAQETCTSTQQVTWLNLQPFLDKFDSSKYTLVDATVVATKSGTDWIVVLEREGDAAAAQWEYVNALESPSEADRDSVVADTD